MNMYKSAQEIIEELGLLPHPEGGYFKEVYRADTHVFSEEAKASRNALTCIYFLLEKGQVSRFHKVKHDEVWNFYLGAPLKLIDLHDNSIDESLLGDYEHSLVSQYVIPANHWQAAESTGDYSLVGCSVAPGFDFADFSFLDENQANDMREKYPEFIRFI